MGGIRQERYIAGPFDGQTQGTLMPGTGAGKAPGLNLPLLGCELTEQFNVLVIDPADPVGTEEAFFYDMLSPLFARLLAALGTYWPTYHLSPSL
jgi:hypothetical protein